MKFTLIFFTVLGNYTCFAQKPAAVIDSVLAGHAVITKDKPAKIDTVPVIKKASIHLYPNPAKNKVEIEIRGFEPGNVQVQLVDNNGNLIRNDKRLVFSGNEIIVLMFSEKPGLYFVIVKQGEINLRNRLIIQ